MAAGTGSVTGDYLAGRAVVPLPASRRPGNGKALVIRGAWAHNLKDLTVRLPLGLLVAVTGPSGSGKSSLLLDVLDRAARQRFYRAGETPGTHDGIDGWEHLDKVVTIDQQAISRVPRSNAATYSDAFTPIREAFAATADARDRGLTPGRTSRSTCPAAAASAARARASSPCRCTSCLTCWCAVPPATDAASSARCSPCATAAGTSPRCSR